MIEFIQANWAVISIALAGLGLLFGPKIKPIIDWFNDTFGPKKTITIDGKSIASTEVKTRAVDSLTTLFRDAKRSGDNATAAILLVAIEALTVEVKV